MSKIICKGHCLSCPVRNRSIFSELPEDTLEDSIKDFHTSVITYDDEETLFHEGDLSQKSAYTLRKGLVKLTKSLPDGRVQIIRVLVAGDLFGFDGLADKSYNVTATALTDCEVCRLPLADLANIRDQHHEVDRSIMARLIINLRQSEDMLLELGAKKASEKLASFLMSLTMRDQTHESSDETQWVELHLSRSEIGSLLGLTIETVSRFLSDWKRKGYIKESKGSIQILDPEGLKKAACSEGSCDKTSK